MTLNEIIECIKEVKEDYWEDDGYGYAITADCQRTLTALDEAMERLEQTRWIPVGERLPNRDEYIKNNGLFIVTDGNRTYSEWYDIYDTLRFGEPTMGGFRVDCAVTAWMTLPESYKTGSEEIWTM